MSNDTMSVDVLGLQFDPATGVSIVLLGQLDTSDRVLPIFIGPAEAQAIGFALRGVELSRPATHDLFVAAIEAAGARVTDVMITALHHDTFIAELGLATDRGPRRIDTRPSDGLALAIRVNAPVTVKRDVFDTASVAIVQDPAQPFSDVEIERITNEFKTFIESTDPSDFADEADTPNDAPTDPDGPER
ncbi:MAG: bifunctional nuclease family protein [Ilumatobacter sp.]